MRGMILEAAVEKRLVYLVEKWGGFCPKFISPGMKGAPDRIVMMPGHPTYYVELKKPKGGTLRPWQDRCHKKIRAAGQRVWVCWTIADVEAFVFEILGKVPF